MLTGTCRRCGAAITSTTSTASTIQVGDFLSYIGLFSYYSFDNWIYQPSYVSSNTPWFFTGMRAQFFPTNKLKIEPWLINGWQTYAKYNGREGWEGRFCGGPPGIWDFVLNTYTLGRDTLGDPYRSRYHADWSQEYKFFEHLISSSRGLR